MSAIVPVSRSINLTGEKRLSGETFQYNVLCVAYIATPHTVFFGQRVCSASLGTLQNASLGLA